MCQSHKRTYGIELEGYTAWNIRGSHLDNWEFIEDGSLSNGDEYCGYCDGGGRINVTCDTCGGCGREECDECDGSGREECHICGGTGECEEEGEFYDCDECGGGGQVECSYCEGDGDIECGDCCGDGEHEEDCHECGGSGSLDCDEYGVECVSDILKEGDYSAIEEVFDYIDGEGWFINSDCGTHVHVGGSDLTVQDLSKLAILMNTVEPIIYGGLPRRRYTTNYSKPINTELVEYLIDKGEDITLKELCNKYYGYERNVDGNFDKYDSARYYGLNLHSWFYRQTIEFRYFDGAGESIQAKAWIDLSIKLVDFAKYSTFESLVAIGRDFYSMNNLCESIEKLKIMLGLEFDLDNISEDTYRSSRNRVAHQMRNDRRLSQAI